VGIASGLDELYESAGEGFVCFRVDYADLALIVRVLAGIASASPLITHILHGLDGFFLVCAYSSQDCTDLALIVRDLYEIAPIPTCLRSAMIQSPRGFEPNPPSNSSDK